MIVDWNEPISPSQFPSLPSVRSIAASFVTLLRNGVVVLTFPFVRSNLRVSVFVRDFPFSYERLVSNVYSVGELLKKYLLLC